MHVIGIDLGGTNIKAAIIHKKDGILNKLSIPTNAEMGRDHVLDRLANTCKQLHNESDGDIIGVGLGLPGMVSLDQRKVYSAPNLPGWDDVMVSDELEKRTGLQWRVENDANVAALGSAFYGKGKNFDSFIMITLGTGVGGGIILNRKLYKGAYGMAAELGHVIIDYHGPISNSVTRGTIEAYLGQRFLSRYASDMIRQHPENPLYKTFQKDFESLEPLDLTIAANEGNELAIEILRKSGTRLGYAIVNYVHMMDIRKFVISGGVAKAGDWLIKPATESALSYLMPPFRKEFEIVYENLGNDSALLGAGSLAFEAFS
jgi:glucokinase